MKTYIITHYPTVGGIAVESSINIRVASEKRAIAIAAKKHLLFGISELYFDESGNRQISEMTKYINYDGVLEIK